MNAFTDTIFILVWFGALVFGIRLMANGWSLMTEQPEQPKKKPIHPEMEDVPDGEELMVINFEELDPPRPEEEIADWFDGDRSRFKLDSPELHNLDPLNKSLKDRIDELKDDDDDDDGGALVPAIR